METSVELAIQQLRDNRLMQTEEQLALYEARLHEMGGDEDVTHVVGLCQAFDDSTDHHEVMSGLIPVIEDYAAFSSREEQLRYFVQGAPSMLPHAAEWLRTMLVRILNNAEARPLLGQLLAASPTITQESVKNALRKIGAESPDRFAGKVAEVIE